MSLAKLTSHALAEQLTVRSSDGITDGRVNLPESSLGNRFTNTSGQHEIRLPQGTVISAVNMGTGTANFVAYKVNGASGYVTLGIITAGESMTIPVWRADTNPLFWIESTDLNGEIRINLIVPPPTS